jgi:phosphoglycerate dehydrogenase-like enzyme
VVFTPHVGANTAEAQKRIGKELVAQLSKMLLNI